MGTPQMRTKISNPTCSITVNGVIVPVLNEPVGNQAAVSDPNMNMSQKLSSLQITICETFGNIIFLNTDNHHECHCLTGDITP